MRNDSRWISVCLPLLTAGCSAAAADLLLDGEPTLATSGRRLHAQLLDDDRGAPVAFLGFIDAETEEPCAFGETPAGLRCIPRVHAELHFGDPACTERVAVTVAGSGHFAVDAEGAYRLGALRPPGLFFEHGSKGCTPVQTDASRFSVRSVVARVPFEFFVPGAMREVDDGVRLTRLGIRADDGAWSPGGWGDRSLGVECVASTGGALDGRCVPARRFVFPDAWGVMDARCERRVLEVDPRSRYVAVSSISLTTDGADEVRPVSGPFEDLEGHRLDADGVCRPAYRIPRAWILGDALPPAELTELRGASSGEGAVVRRGEVAGDGRFGVRPQRMGLDWPSLDGGSAAAALASGEPCRVTHVGGEVRCIPAAGYLSVEPFADEACRFPAVFASPPGELVRLVGQGPDGLPVATEVRAVGAPLDSFYMLDERGCRQSGEVHPGDLYAVGPPSDASAYPVLTVRTE